MNFPGKIKVASSARSRFQSERAAAILGFPRRGSANSSQRPTLARKRESLSEIAFPAIVVTEKPLRFNVREKIKRNQVRRKMFLRGPRLFWAYLINNDYSSATRISHASVSCRISQYFHNTFRFSSISSNSLRGQAVCSDLSADFSLRTSI